MSAAIDIIRGSLYKLGVHSEIKPVSNEMLSYSFKKFQSFVKSLKDQGYNKTGLVVPYALADECSERGGVTNDIEALFAVDIAPYFRVQPTAQLLTDSANAKENLERFYRTFEIPDLLPKRTHFKGQGNK